MHSSIGRFFILGAALIATGCRVDTNQPQAATAQGSSGGVATAAAVSVTPAGVATDSLSGESVIADNFDGTAGLIPEGAPPSIAGDGAAAFRMFCSAGQIAQDDPLFYPGQPGASHLHQFFGNTGTNASSNYQSLRGSGGTTCGQSSTPFNRSAYWFPAMLDGVGNVIKPRYISVYYKRNSASDPMCRPLSTAYQSLGQCVDLPNGIRFAFGYNMQDPSKSTGVNFSCADSDDGLVKGLPGWFPNIAAVVAAGCPVGAQLVIAPNSPNCWDGQYLDAADHRSHMSYATGPWYTGQLFNACPADHPYVIPDMELLIHFTIDANFAKWHLSSDEMVPGAPAGSTMHVDYWEAWSPTIKGDWQNGCINLHYSCGGGALGNGMAIKGGDVPFGGWPAQQLVALSSIPGTTSSTTQTATTQVCPDGSVIPLSQPCPVTSTSPAPKNTGGGKAVGRKK